MFIWGIILLICLVIALRIDYVKGWGLFYSNKRSRRMKGGVWYKVYEWDDGYEHYASYWTQFEPKEYEGWDSGRKIEKIEVYDRS